jgi:hypothetical protein
MICYIESPEVGHVEQQHRQVDVAAPSADIEGIYGLSLRVVFRRGKVFCSL